jgi:energy-coupling factor transporter transmembrane protein EcfT
MRATVLAATTSGAGAVLVIYAALLVAIFVGWVKILRKAGYSGWWSLLIIVPLVNIVMFLVFAFGDWPALRGTRYAGGDPPYPPYPTSGGTWGAGQVPGQGYPPAYQPPASQPPGYQPGGYQAPGYVPNPQSQDPGWGWQPGEQQGGPGQPEAPSGN